MEIGTELQGIRFTTQLNNNHILRYKHEIRGTSTPVQILSPNLPRDTRVKVTLVTMPLLTPVAQKLCRREHGVFTNRTCVHSLILLRVEIVCCRL
jgi:hypothetical protein